jgi:hypothetical protein
MVRNLGVILAASALSVVAQTSVNLSGTVTDSAGVPVSGAVVQLQRGGLSAVSAVDGKFTLTGTTALGSTPFSESQPSLRQGALRLSIPSRTEVAVRVFGTRGEEMASFTRRLEAGSHGLALPATGTGMRFLSVTLGDQETWLRALSIDGVFRGADLGTDAIRTGLKKSTAVAMYDHLTATKAGLEKGYVTLSNSDSAGITIRLLPEKNTFSFFVTSMRTLITLSKSDSGFGGDLRFGETGPGAGLRGADKICATIAEMSMKGSSVKGWRAFLSVGSDAYGKQVNAIDRVGPGPWYDRTGRLLAPTVNDLKAVRPTNGDPTIQLDLPNEWGIPNHRPDPNKPAEDNHHMITGSTTSGTLNTNNATCKDWTTKEGTTANGKPAHGYAWPRGGRVGTSGSHWMSTSVAAGCGAGIEIIETGPGSPTATFIGSGGGYGGFYCFALNP